MKRIFLAVFLQLVGLYFVLKSTDMESIVLLYVLLTTIIISYVIYQKNRGEMEEFEVNTRILESIIKINDSILKVQSKEQLYQLILRKAVEIIPDAQMGSILILKENGLLEFEGTVGFSFNKNMDIKIKLEDTFLYRMSGGNIEKPCIIDDVELFNKDIIANELKAKVKDTDFFITQSTISAPIIINGVLYGMINVDNRKKGAFTKKDLLLMEYFASEVGTVIQRHQLLEKMKYLSQYDSLTNVFNRSYFEQNLSEIYTKAEKEGGYFSIVIFDINDLKVVNDNYGHWMGDQLIITFADEVKKCIDNETLFARYGGDEFIAVFINKKVEEILRVIDTISNNLQKKELNISDKKIPIKFSFGISTYPIDSKDIKRLIAIADARMYKDKDKKKRDI